MEWTKEPLTRRVARGLRAATRMRRIEGHWFNYHDLKELWSASDGHHLVLTHDLDGVWQHWYRDPEDGWKLAEQVYDTREQAQHAAECMPPLAAHKQAGTYLVAWVEGGRRIRVRCGTPGRLATVKEIYEKLGYQTEVEEIPPSES